MFGRKTTATMLVASLAGVALLGGCRGEASTDPSDIPSSAFAANIRLQAGDLQSGPVVRPLPQALTVRVVDAGGQPVAGAAVNWAVLGGGGTVNPPTGISNTQGLVTTAWTLGTELGPQQVRAYLTRGFNLDSVTFSATATVGAPVTIVFDESTRPPATAMVATSVGGMRYQVRDSLGNPVAGARVFFRPTPGSGSVDPSSALTDAGGFVTVGTWALPNLVGVRGLQAGLDTMALLPAVSVQTTPDTSRVLTVRNSSNALPSAVAGTQVDTVIRVLVTDRFDNIIVGETVNFADSLSPGVTVTPTSMVTNASGEASTTVRLGDQLGPAAVRVRIAAGGVNQRVTFTTAATMTFRDVYAGNYSACGIGTNDRAYCWGFGQDGQLGNGALENSSQPVLAVRTSTGAFPTFRSLAGGQSHTCGIGVARSLFCWGFDTEGRQFPTSAASPVRISTATESPVFSVANIRALSAGETHTCVITLGGAAICSGGNDRGQLGNGAVAPGAIAVNVDAGGGRPSLWSAVATGERHTCGMPRFNPAENLFGPGVIRPSQRIWCWGANDHGQLGNATFRDTAVADTVKLPNLIPAFIGFDSMSVVAGASHTCALEAAGNAGRVLCWGSNAFGQLGLGAIDTLAHSAPRVAAVPEPLVRLYAGENHTCGVTAAGVVYCWGRNERGQLNGTASVPVPTPTVVGVPSMRALALGELFTCGITGVPGVPGTTSPAGTIHCWGDNEFGQLGRGSFSANAHPPLAAAPIKGQ